MEDALDGDSRPRSLLTGASTDGSHTSVAIVHDYLTQRGGAERVVLAMLRAFPDATVHTALYRPDSTFPEFRSHRVVTMPIDHVEVLRNHHRAAFPFLAPSFSRHRVEADVTLCSSSGWAHGVGAAGAKVVYCHTPARWLYQTRRYAGRDGGAAAMARLAAASALRAPLQRWDRRAAATADRYLANSRVVQQRVRELYGIVAELLPPPVSIDVDGEHAAVPGVEPGFLMCVSRLLPYKNVDGVLGAMRLLPGERLVVVGAGPELARLRGTAPPNAALLGQVGDAQMRWLYANCAALVAPSHEDFGMVPLEAAAFGKPTAALRWGGFLDTIIDGRTGVFFDEAQPAAIAAAVRLLDGGMDAEVLQEHARSYGIDAFTRRLREVIAEAGANRS
jgi:glycosyltransferase involved in cell wall biosynthesis